MELLNPGTGLIIWQLIIFVGLFLFLAKFAWKPILASLKERETSIQQALDTAERAKQEMAILKSDNEKLLKEAREERERIMREAREAANRMREEANLEAKKAADKIIQDARVAINIEKQAAMKDVRTQVALFSLQIAEKLMRKNLSSDSEQRALVENYMNDIKLS